MAQVRVRKEALKKKKKQKKYPFEIEPVKPIAEPIPPPKTALEEYED